MKIIISPAKKMNWQPDAPVSLTVPEFLEEAEYLRGLLQEKTKDELRRLWQCGEKLAAENVQRLQEFSLGEGLTPAILSYEGLQYQYMAPQVFTEKQWEYVKGHLRILSGFYGVLTPTDGVIPYRLEMQARLANREGKDLYAFWGKRLYESLTREDTVILNLASKEYSRAVEPFLEEGAEMVSCTFGELENGKVKVKGTRAKMARGEMVRWLAENGITEIEEIKNFTGLNYQFQEAYSTQKELVFLPKQQKGLPEF